MYIQIYPEAMLKCRVWFSRCGLESESTVLTRSQVMPILLVRGSKHQNFKLYCALVWAWPLNSHLIFGRNYPSEAERNPRVSQQEGDTQNEVQRGLAPGLVPTTLLLLDLTGDWGVVGGRVVVGVLAAWTEDPGGQVSGGCCRRTKNEGCVVVSECQVPTGNCLWLKVLLGQSLPKYSSLPLSDTFCSCPWLAAPDLSV